MLYKNASRKREAARGRRGGAAACLPASQVLSQHLLMCWFATFFLFCWQCHRVCVGASAFAYANEMLQPLQPCSSNSFFRPFARLCVCLCVRVCVLAVFTALAKQTNRAYGKEIARTTMPKMAKNASWQRDLRFWLPSAPESMLHLRAFAVCRD